MLKLKVAVELKHFRLCLAGAVRANALTCLHGCVLAGNDISYLVQLRFSPNFQLNLQEYLANDSTLPLDVEALRDDRIYYCRVRPLILGLNGSNAVYSTVVSFYRGVQYQFNDYHTRSPLENLTEPSFSGTTASHSI